jgi:hypothetical protein
VILLAIVYFGLAAITLALLTHEALTLGTRVLMIVCLPAVAFAVWRAAQPPTGWPALAQPAKQAQFQWGIVREPDQRSHDPGEIDLWLIPPGATQPRAYHLPYTRQLHKQVQAATKAVKAGMRVGIRKVGTRSGRQAARSRFVLYLLPPPAIEPKG